jgi:protein TonB
MLTIILNLILFFNSNSVIDCPEQWDSVTKMQVYLHTDKMPQYPGGAEAVIDIITSNYVTQDSKKKGYDMSFKIEFVIDQNGKMIGARIAGKKADQLTPDDKELIRVLKLLKPWKPGTCNLKPVPVLMTRDIQFKTS